MDNVRLAKKPDPKGKCDLSAANQALSLLGKELGLFIDRTQNVPWDGDPAKLTSEQAAKFTAFLESQAFAGKPEELEAWRTGEGAILQQPAQNEAEAPKVQ